MVVLPSWGLLSFEGANTTASDACHDTCCYIGWAGIWGREWSMLQGLVHGWLLCVLCLCWSLCVRVEFFSFRSTRGSWLALGGTGPIGLCGTYFHVKTSKTGAVIDIRTWPTAPFRFFDPTRHLGA